MRPGNLIVLDENLNPQIGGKSWRNAAMKPPPYATWAC